MFIAFQNLVSMFLIECCRGVTNKHMFFCLTEIKKMQSSVRDHFLRIFNDHEKLKLQLETQKKKLELQGIELEKREARNEIDRKALEEEIEKVVCLHLAWFEVF